MAAKFELKQGQSGQYSFNLKAANGEVILSSETYKEKASAESGIESVRRSADEEARFERKVARNGKPFFVLTASNGQIVGKSEMYESAASRDNGIASVRRSAAGARVEDLTGGASGAPKGAPAKTPKV